jgi:hypothetical protein
MNNQMADKVAGGEGKFTAFHPRRNLICRGRDVVIYRIKTRHKSQILTSKPKIEKIILINE